MLTYFLVKKYGKRKIVIICGTSLTVVNIILSILWFYAYSYSENLIYYEKVPAGLWYSIIIMIIIFRSNIALGTVAPMMG